MRRAGLLVVVGGLLLGTGAALGASSLGTVRLWQDRQREFVTHGQVVVTAPPAKVLAVAQDVDLWPRVFSDVSWAKVEDGDASRPTVTFRSETLGQSITMQRTRLTDRDVRFDLLTGPPGAHGHAVVAVKPHERGSLVQARMFMGVSGLRKLDPVSDMLRQKREAKLRKDLTDLARYFGGKR